MSVTEVAPMFHRAIVHDFGEPSRVVVVEPYSLPKLQPGMARLRMKMSAINPSDLISISGAYRSRTPLPFLPGFEGLGTVSETGPGCTKLRVGQRVIPIGFPGSWQEIKDNSEEWCLEVPDHLSDEEATTSYVNPMTAWAMVKHAYDIRPGMTIALSSAGSTIGRMIVRLANEMGITPFAFHRSEQAAENFKGLAVWPIRYSTSPGLSEICTRWPGPSVDAFFDCVGGEEAASFSRILKPEGLFVHYGLLSGRSIDLRAWQRPNARIELFHLRNWIRMVPLSEVHAAYNSVTRFISDGCFSTVVRARYPLAEVGTALVDASSHTSSGKVILVHKGSVSANISGRVD